MSVSDGFTMLVGWRQVLHRTNPNVTKLASTSSHMLTLIGETILKLASSKHRHERILLIYSLLCVQSFLVQLS